MYLHSINKVLSHIEPYGLKDLKNANLMNRVDSKFLLPVSGLANILTQLQHSYRVLEINGQRISNYNNQYYDTLPMKFYHDHHNGKLSRFKVRHRQYVDTQTSFLEVKHKTNQGRTHKTRINIANDLSQSPVADDFIFDSVGIPLKEMQVSQYSGYQRIALANEETAERLTIDFNLWYALDLNYKIKLPNICIAELKQARKSKDSPFYSLQENTPMSPLSFSKYCIGCALLHQTEIKSNRFKPTLNKLSNMLQQYNSINTHLHTI
ncbi:MAG: hypothetical protein ACJAT7_000463 [Psychromonas sp.]|jgi:hypothetical protein|uniref:polyphosphate polymerase domain-containing protein n=1 Tax=Psychromonas sp. TaxID=1884585 RepID=UPI0039E28AB2